MIVPKWPYPASLHYHNILIGEWQNLEDQPTHFEIHYELLDVDFSGHDPHHPEYQYCPKSAFYHIARQCQKSLQKVLLKTLKITYTRALIGQIACTNYPWVNARAREGANNTSG